MSAILKIYTDVGHTNEVAHIANVSTTLNGAISIGATSLQVVSVAGMPSSGCIDIDTGGNLETVAYVSITSNTLNIASSLSLNHSSGVSVIQWTYQLAIGDQSTGLLNDGSNSSPISANTATFYLYNAGDQIARSVSLTTSSALPSTANGYTDTLLSITNSTSGFATSVSIGTIAVGAIQQFWVCEEIPSGQSIAGSQNPQKCLILINATSL